jgi:hypothetical protein
MALNRLDWRKYVAQQIADSRERTLLSRKLLGATKPDTFAGRKTQEPFPVEDAKKRPDVQKHPVRCAFPGPEPPKK